MLVESPLSVPALSGSGLNLLSPGPPPCRRPRSTSQIFFHVSHSTSASILYSFSNPFQASPSHQKSSKKLPKPSPRPSQNYFKTASHLATPEILKKIRPSHTKPSFLTFPSLRKSFQNRCPNAFIIGSILDALLEPPKIRIWMPKRRQDGPLSFHYFEKFRQKNLILPVFGP